MSRMLFDMSDAELNRAVERHYDQMFSQYYHEDEPEPCCKNCRYHNGSDCCISDYIDGEEDYMTVDDDDYCDRYKADDRYPDWLDGDR